MTLVTGGASVAANRIRRPDDTIDLMEEEKTKEQPDVTETIRQAIDKAKKEEAKTLHGQRSRRDLFRQRCCRE